LWSICKLIPLGALSAKAAIPALIKALGDTDAEVRSSAAWALEKMGPAAKDAVPALTKALRDVDANVRMYAAYALGDIGAAAKPAVQELERLAEKDPDKFVRNSARDALESIRKAGTKK
jgi:HEAT repeat protein